MKMKIKSAYGLLLFVLFTPGLNAKPVVPDSTDVVVAKWQLSGKQKTADNLLERVQWHIEQGQQPGKANLHLGRAKALLQTFEQKQDPQFQYLKARILQHQHLFEESLVWLNKITFIDADNTNAWLLKANIYLTQGKFKQARSACLRLAGLAQGPVFSGCLLEVQGYLDSLEKSYQTLSQLVEEPQQRDVDTDQWLHQILAEQALRLGKLDEASHWLNPTEFKIKPLSYVVLWADIQLSLGHYQSVFDVIGALLESTDSQDDALLVRIVLAEQQLGLAKWIGPLQRQIELRLARKDTYHAADIARYFLDIKTAPEQALYWANINWQQAKLHEDLILLKRAKAASEVNTHG